MLCAYCGMEYDEGLGKCPYCGAVNDDNGHKSSAPVVRDEPFSGTVEGTKGKLIRFLSGKCFLAVSVLLTVMTSLELVSAYEERVNILEVIFGVLATVAAWMAYSAANKGELKLKKGMLMALPIFESVMAIFNTVILIYGAVAMTVLGVISVSSVENANKALTDMAAVAPTYLGDLLESLALVMEQLNISDAATEQTFYIALFFCSSASIFVSAAVNLVAGVFAVIAGKKLKKLIVVGNCDGDLPKGLKKSGGVVIAAGILAVLSTINPLYGVILIILGAGMRKLASE